MIDLLEPRRLLAPWITTEVAGRVYGQACDVEVADGKAYVLMNGLAILDVSAPGTPIQLGGISLGGGRVSVSGSYAYLWAGAYGTDPNFRIVDISNPAHPALAGSCRSGSAYDACVVGSCAYLAVPGLGLQIIDVSNPTSPVLAGSLAIDRAYSVTAAGSYAYVSSYSVTDTILTVVNVADPAHPVQVGSCHAQGGTADLAIEGTTVYSLGGGMSIIDVSNPSAPAEIIWYHATGSPVELRVSNSVVYIVGGANTMEDVDVSDPSNPRFLGLLDTHGNAYAIALSGSTAYVVDGVKALEVVDIENPSMPTAKAVYNPPDAPKRVAFSGTTAYVNDDNQAGFHIMDIQNFDAPTWVGRRDTRAQVNDIAVSGSCMYLTEGAGMEVFDISTPANPVLAGTYNPGGTGQADYLEHMVISGSYAYVTANTRPFSAGNSALNIFDLADPSAPRLVGKYSGAKAAWDVAISGSIAYLAAADGLRIIDVSSPANPVDLYSLRTVNHALNIFVYGSRLYFYSDPNSYIMDVSNPVAPVVLNSNAGAAILALSGNLAYTAHDILDVSDPSAVMDVGLCTLKPGVIALYGDSSALLLNSEFETVRFHIGENEPATDIALSQNSIAENLPTGGVIGTFSSRCLNPSNTFSYALVYGAGSTGNGSFTISGNQLKTSTSFDYEVNSSYPIMVRSTDAAGQWFEKAFRISVTDVNERPTDLSISAGSVAEHQPVGTAVATLSSSDPDAGNTFTYSLVSGTGSADNGSFAIVGNTLRTAAIFDQATKGSYSIRLRTTDQGGLFTEKTFTILVTSGNRTPTDITLSPASIAENQPADSVVGALASTDLDTGNTFTYTLVSGVGSVDDFRFAINGSDLQVDNSLDYEARNTYSIRIRTTDQGGLWFEKAFTVGVTNVNEAPTNIALSKQSVAEKQPPGAVVGTLTSIDPDAGNTFTYTLQSGAGSNDNSSFRISGNQLLTAVSFTYGARNFYSIRVRSTDQGGLFYEKALWVAVIINLAPTDISVWASSIAENRPTDTVVGTFSTADPNSGNTFTYMLVEGDGSQDNASFMISGNELWTTASFDYETRNSYSIRVRSTDQGGLSFEKALTIHVTDVDEIGPRVTAVYVRGSSWNTNYLSFLADNLAGSSSTYGYAIPAGSGANQLQTLPWRNINQISIAFNEDVSIVQSQFAIVGSVGSYNIVGFSYDSTDHVITCSLSAAIGPDRLYVTLQGSGSYPLTDVAGNVLDGEWTNPSSYSDAGPTNSFPSGNGSAGGDFAFRFDRSPYGCVSSRCKSGRGNGLLAT